MRGTRPAFSVGEIVRATVGSLEVGKTDTQAFGVSTDSRTVEAGNLFVALRGDRFDGHDFLAKAAEKRRPVSWLRREHDLPGPPAAVKIFLSSPWRTRSGPWETWPDTGGTISSFPSLP